MDKSKDKKKRTFEEEWMDGEEPMSAPLSAAVAKAREKAGKIQSEYVEAHREMDKDDR